MADLPLLTPATGQTPTLGAHLVTKDYVDTTARNAPINARTTAYTLVLSDQGKVVEVNSASALQVTVPSNASVAFPVGTVIRVRKMGTGNVTVAGAVGVTINWASAFVISTRYTMAEIQKQASDTWVGVLLGS